MRRALLAGVNDYPTAPLAGCVNDVRDVAKTLVEVYAFGEQDIRLLTDGRATRAGILERLDWLADARAGDVVYFHWSGHGTQVATRDKAGEIDGLDEVICLSGFDWSDDTMIRDTEFAAWIRKTLRPGVRAFATLDSCHSGDFTRDLNGAVRAFPPPADVLWQVQAALALGYGRSSFLTAIPTFFANIWQSLFGKGEKPQSGDETLPVALIAGCLDTQTAAETQVGGRPCGAFTHHLCAAMRQFPRSTARGLTTEVVRRMNSWRQTPIAEGLLKDIPFLKEQQT